MMKRKESNKTQWKIVLRGPAIWTLSCCALIFAYAVWARAAVDPVLPIPCLAAAIVFFFGMTAFSISLFWHDVWVFVLQPVLLKPAIEAASKFSLDDVLRFLCDPTQLLAAFTGIIMFPVTLYTLPTTVQQRAQVLQTSGLIPNDGRDPVSILTRPGGWKELLSSPVRRFLRQAVKNSEAQEDSETESDSDENSVSSAPDRDTIRCQYSISPVYRTKTHDLNDAHTTRKGERTTLESSPRLLHRQTQEPHQVLGSIVTDLFQAKVSSFCDSLRQRRKNLVPTAVAAAVLLAMQLRHSRTARSNLKSLLHMVVTASAGTALTGSFLALLAPYFSAQQQQPLMRSRESSTRGRRAHSRSRPQAGSQNATDWPVVVSSILAAATAVLSTMPKSPVLKRQLPVVKALMKWKGVIAVFVLLYFQQRRRRHRQQLEREEEQETTA